MGLYVQFQTFLQTEVGPEKDGAFPPEKFCIHVFQFVFGAFDVIDEDGKENFFFNNGGDLGVVNVVG
jgi:hypothetical protein